MPFKNCKKLSNIPLFWITILAVKDVVEQEGEKKDPFIIQQGNTLDGIPSIPGVVIS